MGDIEDMRVRLPNGSEVPFTTVASGTSISGVTQSGVTQSGVAQSGVAPSDVAQSRPAAVAPRFEEVPADEAEVKQFHKRLRYSIDQRHFLALVVSPRRALRAEPALAASFPLTVRNLDALLIRHMKTFAAERKVDWQVVLRADAATPEERAGKDWRNLLVVVRNALSRVKAELAEEDRHVLLRGADRQLRVAHLP